MVPATAEEAGPRLRAFFWNAWEWQSKVKLREVDSGFFAERYFAARPRSEQLVNNELKRVASFLTRDWRVCLKEYLGKFNWNLWDLDTSGMERSFYKNYLGLKKSIG